MKKIIVLILAAVALLLGLGGCKDSNTFYHSDFELALVELPSGEVMSIEMSSWKFYRCGFYAIAAKDGKKYVVPIARCVLIGESTGDAAE
jgi:hypothetical protein